LRRLNSAALGYRVLSSWSALQASAVSPRAASDMPSLSSESGALPLRGYFRKVCAKVSAAPPTLAAQGPPPGLHCGLNPFGKI
jgi:hypothetical protein